MNRFNDALARSNEVMENIMGEPFLVGGREYAAIDIGERSTSERVMPGGTDKPGSLVIHLRAAVLADCALKPLADLQARGVNLQVDGMKNEGDGTHTLICGPSTFVAKL